ncbi:MAG: dienelactone hydrolase family protein [Chloroflexota bacterium]|nr:dienelactone hydrolase family protein [Chloroflexota bacterium]
MSPHRVPIAVPTGELEGTLHLPDGDAIGGCVVLHGFGGHPEQPHVVATCEALANARVAAVRFAFRDHDPPRMTIASALEDAVGALRLLRTHPRVPQRYGVVGFSFGGAVAALAAGRDHRVGAAVLAAAPSLTRGGAAGWSGGGKWRPVAELSHTRARVLLIWGTEDTQVPFVDAESYSAVLSQARVTHRVVKVEGGDHDFEPAAARERMTAAVADWVAESFAGPGPR